MRHKSRISAAILSFGLLASFGCLAADAEVKMLNEDSNGERGFAPAIVHVKPGDSVHFVAFDKGHSVQSIPGMIPDGAKPFAGKVSEDLTVKFDRPGVYGYRCVPHYMMGMVGLVVVGDPVNEAAARNVAQPRDAKARFDRLFAELDAKRTAAKSP
ncbi:pseudoazurin [Robbsia andropogonis]|uniref:pseudoazurin n=1 Tax=Robbsia andropogonis TaxID=28092 RepID=UPI000463768F|nr:pseudoazurin [Robbsia andropogonis]MCP1119341.1 pseudoazurin [Robbsia andropogonis]MCP1129181.1 pseudoazurin [Robbsia andropogonis]